MTADMSRCVLILRGLGQNNGVYMINSIVQFTELRENQTFKRLGAQQRRKCRKFG